MSHLWTSLVVATQRLRLSWTLWRLMRQERLATKRLVTLERAARLQLIRRETARQALQVLTEPHPEPETSPPQEVWMPAPPPPRLEQEETLETLEQPEQPMQLETLEEPEEMPDPIAEITALLRQP